MLVNETIYFELSSKYNSHCSLCFCLLLQRSIVSWKKEKKNLCVYRKYISKYWKQWNPATRQYRQWDFAINSNNDAADRSNNVIFLLYCMYMNLSSGENWVFSMMHTFWWKTCARWQWSLITNHSYSLVHFRACGHNSTTWSWNLIFMQKSAVVFQRTSPLADHNPTWSFHTLIK